MTPVRFAHIGGSVIADHGPVSLAVARALAETYRREGIHEAKNGRAVAALVCADRAQSLAVAVTAATQWRQAAGWGDPDSADR
jgi:hypothetical protein